MHWQMRFGWPFAYRAIVSLLFLGACFAAFAALVVFWMGYYWENSEPSALGTAQFVVAMAGLVPAYLALHQAFRSRYYSSASWLVLAAAVYATWGVMNEIVVRGAGSVERSVPFAYAAGAAVVAWSVFTLRRQ